MNFCCLDILTMFTYFNTESSNSRKGSNATICTEAKEILPLDSIEASMEKRATIARQKRKDSSIYNATKYDFRI